MKSVWYSLFFFLPLLFVGCADAGKDQLVKSSTNVVLDGSSSTTEVNGEIVKYRWKQIEGIKVNLLNKKEVLSSFVAPTVLEDTKLIFKLTTVEKGGYISPLKTIDDVEIIVQAQTSNNNPPIATIQASDTEIKLNQTINFDASSSTDSDGTIVTYEWTDTNDDIISSDKVFDYTFTSVGNHTITLNITDDGGLSSSTSIEIVVNDLIKPVANISVNADTININQSVIFDASASSDTDGEVVLYTWKDTDSNILSHEKIYTHTFDTQGQYPITLTVEDNDGLTHSEEIIITVQAVLTSIDITPQELSLEIGHTETISATGNYNDGTTLDITSNTPWTISDNTILSIDNTGTITALKAGTATIKTVIEDVESNIVTINISEPITLQSIKISPNPITLRVNKDTQIYVKGLYSDGTTKDIEDSITYEIADTNIISFDSISTLSGLQIGETTLKLTIGDISTALIPVKVNAELITTNFDFTHFGTQYIDQIPNDATKEKYDEKLLSMIRGKILDEERIPIEGIKISIHNQPEYGSTFTGDDGEYTIAVEGRKYLQVRYEKLGYTTIDRKVYAEAENWSITDDVTMLKIDEKVTTINLNNSTPQIHNSTIITDDRGSRATTLVFNGVTSATVKSKDGSTRILESLDVRATEFKTPESMPSDLPVESAYTYCSDLTVDGVQDDETVEFNAPVIMYVDNFLGFEIGEIVPIGYYDRNKGEWVGSKNGAVVELLDTDGDGKVDGLDATGDGIADDLDEDGNTSSEVKGIEDNPDYSVGMTYWRAEITHFTPWDHNWPMVPPKDAVIPPKTNNTQDKPGCKVATSSYVTSKERIFHDDIKIAGTDLTLHYSSENVQGGNKLIEISNIVTPPLSTKSVSIELQVAGKKLTKIFLPEDFSSTVGFEWDGKDIYGNKLKGTIKGTLYIKYEYKVEYAKANENFFEAWAKIGDATTGVEGRTTINTYRIQQIDIDINEVRDIDNSISNGWSLSNHNIALNKLIQNGDGTIEEDFFSNRKLTVIENPNSLYGDNWNPGDISYGNDNNLYFVGEDSNVSKIIKFNPLDTPEIIAGEGTLPISDGLNAKDTKFDFIKSITTDNIGNIYFVHNYRQIKKIDTNGIISTFAGTGEYGFFGDNGVATLAKFISISDIEFDLYENMYIVDAEKIRKIDKSGIITTIAGTETDEFLGDGGLAINASFYDLTELAIDAKGNIYTVGSWSHRIRRIDAITGIITTIAGNGEGASSGAGGYASLASIYFPSSIDVDNEGNIYIAETRGHKVSKIDKDGIISTLTNTFTPRTLTLGKEDTLYIGDESSYNIFKSERAPVFGIDIQDNIKFYVNSNNTADIYDLASGRHLKTIDLFTKKTLKEFQYDDNNRLIGIIDQFENALTITRDSSGNPTSITAPNGQVTQLNVDSYGDLVNVTYEDGSQYQFEYIEGSLLSKVTHPNNSKSVNLYDGNGRIIKELDANGEEWIFNKVVHDTYKEYLLSKPEDDLYIYKDYKLENGYEKSENILPSGEIISIVSSGDEKEVESTTNGVKVNKSYTTDFKTNKKILEKSIVTQPSGLQKTIIYNTEYFDNKENVTLSKTKTITISGKSLLVKNDYEYGINSIQTPEGRVWKNEYDITTRLKLKTISGNLTPTKYTYDNLGRVVSQITGTRTVSYRYNTRGNIETVTDPRNKTTSYEYDILDRTTKVTHPNGSIENYTYDSGENMTKLITPTSTNHDFTYDNLDQRKSMQSPLKSLTSYTYNGNRKLTKIERPSGKTLVNTYVDDKLATTVTQEATTTYDYIFNNKIGTITKVSEKVDFTYDGDLLTSVRLTGELNQILSYSYNNDFLSTSFAYAGDTESYTYDNDNLLLSSGNYTLTRDSDNAYVTKLTDGSLVQDYTYDNYGELTKLSNDSFTYEITAKDNSSLITQKTETINNTTTTYDYTYDNNARLVEVKKDNTIVESYSYDDNGNRLNATVNAVTTSASYTLDDQLEVYGNNTYRYDEDGYLQEKTTPDGVTTYSYSTLGELKTVTTPTKIIEYKHNASNQRVAKLVNGVVVEKYLWANLTTLLAVYDKDDNLIQRFEYASDRMPISMTQGSNKYYLHYDQVGSLRTVFDSNHNIVKEIVYDSFGNILSDSNENFSVAFGFAGGLLDRDTGLTRFGYRDYDSYTGKWTAKDPIDFAGGDSNLYGYVLGDPVNFIDPLGLFWDDPSNYGDYTFSDSSCGAENGARFPNGFFEQWSIEDSCQLHDECYGKEDAPKDKCDQMFLEHMNWNCEKVSDSISKQLCKNQAKAYYSAVKYFGKDAYENGQKK